MRRMLIAMALVAVLTWPVTMGRVVLAGQTAPAGAPQARFHHSPAEREVERMREALNLTEAQRAKILPILEQRNRQLKDLRAQSSLPQGYARAKASEIRKSARRRIDMILTPEQRAMQKMSRRAKE